MDTKLRYDGRVVIVTGGGGGLGRSHAISFAIRGAKVVVNDLGTSLDGSGNSSKSADNVVEEIRKLGGIAVPNYDSVEFGDKIVKTAIDNFGRVDIVINNAGFIRDMSFMKMKEKDWDIIQLVHAKGSYSVTKAAWPYMKEQNFGRIIMTSSSSGLYGNFGQSNYSTAKMAVVGFMNTLALEGEKYNILCNTICPIATSRLTESLFQKELLDVLTPENVSPLVLYLCHESTFENGGTFEVGGGWMSKVHWQISKGVMLPPDQPLYPETIRENWNKVVDFSSSYNSSNKEERREELYSNIAKYFQIDFVNVPSKKLNQTFSEIKTIIDENQGKLVNSAKAIFAIELGSQRWVIDLKNGKGSIRKGIHPNPDLKIDIKPEQFLKIYSDNFSQKSKVKAEQLVTFLNQLVRGQSKL